MTKKAGVLIIPREVYSLLKCVPKKDARKVLLGIHVSRISGGFTRYVATDGRQLISLKFSRGKDEDWIGKDGFILDAKRLKIAFDLQEKIKVGRKWERGTLTIENVDENNVRDQYTKLYITKIVGKYPEFEKIMPKIRDDDVEIGLGSLALTPVLNFMKSFGHQQQAIKFAISQEDIKKNEFNSPLRMVIRSGTFNEKFCAEGVIMTCRINQ